MQKKPKVLFLSTGNSTRGLMAEGFLRSLAGEHFHAASTGTQATEVHPMAVDIMGEVGIDISGQEPLSVAESLRDQFGYVVIVYDPAKERSPIFPFTPHLLHWSIADPATAEGSPAEKAEAFRRVRDEIREKIGDFIDAAVPALMRREPVRQEPAPMAA